MLELYRKIFCLFFAIQAVISDDTLQIVDDAEFSKLVKEEKYVVALFCSNSNAER